MKSKLVIAGMMLLVSALPLTAQEAKEIEIVHKDRAFAPNEISVPANTAFTLRVKNSDGKSIEFESKAMKVEKVIAANSEAIIKVRPLKPGKYVFEDEFHEATRGTVIAK